MKSAEILNLILQCIENAGWQHEGCPACKYVLPRSCLLGDHS